MKLLKPKSHGKQFIVQFRHPKRDGQIFSRSLGDVESIADIVCEELTRIANDPELSVIENADHPALADFQKRTREICFDIKDDDSPSMIESFEGIAKVLSALDPDSVDSVPTAILKIAREYARRFPEVWRNWQKAKDDVRIRDEKIARLDDEISRLNRVQNKRVTATIADAVTKWKSSYAAEDHAAVTISQAESAVDSFVKLLKEKGRTPLAKISDLGSKLLDYRPHIQVSQAFQSTH